MNQQTITIDGVEYARISPDQSEWRIVIAQRGWVFVGRWHDLGNDEIVLHNASVIRKWGTTAGLGELVGGPLASTVLDPAGTVRLHRLAVVATLDADPVGWDVKAAG